MSALQKLVLVLVSEIGVGSVALMEELEPLPETLSEAVLGLGKELAEEVLGGGAVLLLFLPLGIVRLQKAKCTIYYYLKRQ